jgi:hypothetical protein
MNFQSKQVLARFAEIAVRDSFEAARGASRIKRYFETISVVTRYGALCQGCGKF